MEIDVLIFKGVDFPPEPFISSLSMQSFFTSKGGAAKGTSKGKGSIQAKPTSKSPGQQKTSAGTPQAAGKKPSS